jgi:hypothetical protein
MSEQIDLHLSALRNDLLRLKHAHFAATGGPSGPFMLSRLACFNGDILSQAIAFERIASSQRREMAEHLVEGG